LTTEEAEKVERMQHKRVRKGKVIREGLSRYEQVKVYGYSDAKTALVCWGSGKGACSEAASILGLKMVQPVVLEPFPAESFRAALSGVETVINVEANATGQFTPTSPSTYIGRSTPRGAPEEPLNPIELVLSAGATFVARAFTGSAKHLQGLLKAAIHHKGFAFIDVLLPCLTFYNTGDYYKEKIYELEQTAHDPANPDEALSKAREWAYGENEAERIPTGLFYQSEKPTYSQRLLAGRIPVQMEQKDIRPVLTQLK